jgi:hypothetical protein
MMHHLQMAYQMKLLYRATTGWRCHLSVALAEGTENQGVAKAAQHGRLPGGHEGLADPERLTPSATGDSASLGRGLCA